ncbi:SDR family NAD(P)-dependent oxidoreductase [Paraburkholderia strydomiana]|uniref:SDR family NAD(P)-dependent oxidoreductase n=1 Tax=Paraburkholderia strydomiana TaxID=1245417 RepID=UPI0038B884F0
MLSRYASEPTKSFSAAQAKARLPANVLGTLLAMKHRLRAMSAPRSGSIVNVSSTMGARGPVQTPMLDRLTQTSERKAAFLDTVPLKRAGTPDEIAEAIVYGVGQLHDGRSAACERRPDGVVSHATLPCLSGMAHNL